MDPASSNLPPELLYGITDHISHRYRFRRTDDLANPRKLQHLIQQLLHLLGRPFYSLDVFIQSGGPAGMGILSQYFQKSLDRD